MPSIFIFKEILPLFEAIAAITGFITWRKWKKSYFKWFPVYLAALALCDFSGYLLALAKNYKAVSLLYNSFVIPMEISFVCWLFYKSLPADFRKTIISLWMIYFVFLVLDHTIFVKRDYIFLSISYSVGNMVILILVLRYLIRLILSEDILHFKSDLLFWIASGLLVFYLGTCLYYGLYNLMAKKALSSFINYSWITIFLGYAMYILFTLGFIWSKAK